MGQVIPLASAYGVNIENLAASYAQLTKNGVATAQAGTYLKSMLNELGDSGSDVGEILKSKTGKSFGQLMNDGMSLGDVLGILNDSVNGDSEALAGLWSSSEAGTGALSILSSGVGAFNDELGNMQDSTGNVADALETLSTPSAKAQESLNAVKNAGIELDSAALEAIAPLLEQLAETVKSLTERFSNLSPATQTVIVAVMASGSIGACDNYHRSTDYRCRHNHDGCPCGGYGSGCGQDCDCRYWWACNDCDCGYYGIGAEADSCL